MARNQIISKAKMLPLPSIKIKKKLIAVFQIIKTLKIQTGITIKLQLAVMSAFLYAFCALVSIDHPILPIIIRVGSHCFSSHHHH